MVKWLIGIMLAMSWFGITRSNFTLLDDSQIGLLFLTGCSALFVGWLFGDAYGTSKERYFGPGAAIAREVAEEEEAERRRAAAKRALVRESNTYWRALIRLRDVLLTALLLPFDLFFKMYDGVKEMLLKDRSNDE